MLLLFPHHLFLIYQTFYLEIMVCLYAVVRNNAEISCSLSSFPLVVNLAKPSALSQYLCVCVCVCVCVCGSMQYYHMCSLMQPPPQPRQKTGPSQGSLLLLFYSKNRSPSSPFPNTWDPDLSSMFVVFHCKNVTEMESYVQKPVAFALAFFTCT